MGDGPVLVTSTRHVRGTGRLSQLPQVLSELPRFIGIPSSFGVRGILTHRSLQTGGIFLK